VIILVLLALLVPFSAHASTPMDFARGFNLEAEEGFALQRLELPFEVYNASVRADLGDLRVFNAEGAEVPVHLRRMGAEPATAHEVPLPLFRVGTRKESGQDYDFRLHVRTSDQGAVLETRMIPLSASADQALLLDASANTVDLAALRFELEAPSSVFVRIVVRGSDDLASWQTAGSGVLASMEHQNGSILQDRIALSGKRWKYYLVTGLGDLSALSVAYAEKSRGDSGMIRRFASLNGTLVEDGTYEYALPSALPVDVLDMADVDNAVLGVNVLTPSGDGWRSVGAGSLFRMTVEGQALAGPGLALRGPHERFRIRMQGAPVPLRVGWTPHELVFMPQGSGPFTLALGNPSIPRGPDMLAPMLQDKGIGAARLGKARIGAPVTLGGEDRLLPERDFTRIVLWAVLGLGVILLGAMAWHLVRTMEHKK